MLVRLFHALDDFLIDRIFQPICDALRKLFGWSKKVPTATTTVLTAMSLMPIILLCIHIGGIMYLPGTFSSLYMLGLLWLSYHLFQNEFADESRKIPLTAAMDPSRAKKRTDREQALFLTVVLILLFIILPVPIPKTFLINDPFDIFSMGLVANLCRGYFQACTDLPPGKTVFAKLKEQLTAMLSKPIAAS